MNIEKQKKYDALIKIGLEKADMMEDGTKEKLMAIEYVERVQKLKFDEERAELEKADKLNKFRADKQKFELEFDRNKAEKRDKWIDRLIKIGLTCLDIGLPLALYAAFLNKGFEFEKEGTFTSLTFKNLFGKLGRK